MKPFRILAAGFVAALLLAPASSSGASPSPTPVPGGANQVAGISGTVGDTLFNGVVRLTVQAVRVATAAEGATPTLLNAGQKGLLLQTLVKNGTKTSFAEVLTYTLADADGVTAQVPSYMISPNPLSVQQGAAARQRAVFPVDAAFKPVKLLVQCSTCRPNSFRAFRVTLPALAEPAPSTSP